MTSNRSFREKCREFLAVAPQFCLGDLPTEQIHPESTQLSSLSSQDLPQALRILHNIDASALEVLLREKDRLRILAGRIHETFQAGRKVFICGCGATGRLALTLETVWRAQHGKGKQSEDVLGFMAGGDLALIKSIEKFEDFPEYADRQLTEAGFGVGDLLISCTEGGETPFVIGATEKALELSERTPFFLYCNPDHVLSRVADRSRRVIENPRIEKISLDVGPMAISGSTRMQASTVLMAAVGVCLLYHGRPFDRILEWIDSLITAWGRLDTSFLEPFTIRESEIYAKGEFVLYGTDENFGISILTDTTERAPTFSLFPFENGNEDQQALSWCYLYFPHAENSRQAWELLLRRRPRTLEWDDIGGVASNRRLLGFDFSRGLWARRHTSGDTLHHLFEIYPIEGGLRFQLEGATHCVPTLGLDTLAEHLLLKLILNTHSTLIMGRMGRYQGNLMTWVRPSNNKLIDRAIRYVDALLKAEGVRLSYEEITLRCFEVMERLPGDQSLVLNVVASILKKPTG